MNPDPSLPEADVLIPTKSKSVPTFDDFDEDVFEEKLKQSTNHWAILDSEDNAAWSKLSVTPESSKASSSPSSSHEMTTFDNWEYSTCPSGMGDSDNSKVLLVVPEVPRTVPSTNPFSHYL